LSTSRLCAALLLGFAAASMPSHAAAPAAPAAPPAFLNPVFQDHAVLQRDEPIRLWGSAAPGAVLTVSIAGASADAHADASGAWTAQLPAMAAGGPYTVSVRSGDGAVQTISDVLVGDVYLCSGQSNMAFPVLGAIDAGPDIQVSANDTIRLISIPNVTALSPQRDIPASAKWAAADPATVPTFSAACYFFGRDLQKSVHVPLGLINSSWGGANITTFMSADGLRAAGGEDAGLDALKLYAAEPAAGMKHWGELIEDWWRRHTGSTPWTDPSASADWPLAPQGLGIWSQWGVPELEHFAGHVWFRTSVTLTAAQAAEEAQLSLGTITEEDQTWVNGRFVAATFGYGQPRTYALAPGTLHEGANDLLVNDYCGWRGCGLFGPPEARAIKFKDGTSVPLAGAWRYQIVPPSVGTSPRVPWGATAGLTVAYNAMIAPLEPYGLKGVLWYQGESNTGEPEAYRGLLKAWMADWRTKFETSLPFLIVQLPDYGLPPIAPEDSDWSRLRESQRLAADADPNSALVVTIDIGDHLGLHPADKQEVGRRLALAARRLVYRDGTLKPGPMPLAARMRKRTVSVVFTGANGDLVTLEGQPPVGFELCGDAQESCRFVPAALRGSTVTLAVPRTMRVPTRVRYCWGGGPVCTLYDSSRIPAVPFELALARAPLPKAKPKRH